ncbi:MAG TPA: DUF4124 domain-containing protein [Gammaproteobacteria bacterium]|nr:DUF4124 domain-containing protein [Gammaproteobacteria bacterium]
MRTCLIVLTLLAAGTASAVPVWKWVDASGQTHYTDVPVPGAQRIEVLGVDSVPAAAARSTGTTQAAGSAARPAVPYQRFVVVSPAQQQTLWNIQAMLDVQVEVEPALEPGHHIDVFLDGQRINIGATSTQFTVPEVYRGVHTLQAVIADSNGQDVVRSLAVTFMVQQTSVLNPNNRQPPAAGNRPAPN